MMMMMKMAKTHRQQHRSRFILDENFKLMIPRAGDDPRTRLMKLLLVRTVRGGREGGRNGGGGGGGDEMIGGSCDDRVVVSTMTIFRRLSDLKLTSDAQRLLSTPNAGGSSIISEVVSFEALSLFLGRDVVSLTHTETEIAYNNSNGKITDMVIAIDGRNSDESSSVKVKVAVSVTRAMQFSPLKPFDAQSLLRKKLLGCQLSSENMNEEIMQMGANRTTQILHVLCQSPEIAQKCMHAFHVVPRSIRGNTILFLTAFVDNHHETMANNSVVFTNKI
jgi:hypothetical protein